MGNPFFTADNAKAYGKAGRAKQLANGIRKPGYHKPQESPTAELQDSRAREVLELIQEQIEETRDMLNDKTSCYCETCKRSGIDANARAKLLVGLDRLLERERVWSQRAGPGQLRPETTKRTARYWELLSDAMPYQQAVNFSKHFPGSRAWDLSSNPPGEFAEDSIPREWFPCAGN